MLSWVGLPASLTGGVSEGMLPPPVSPQVSGSKGLQKLYKRHTTGRPGSMKEETFDQLQAVRSPPAPPLRRADHLFGPGPGSK